MLAKLTRRDHREGILYDRRVVPVNLRPTLSIVVALALLAAPLRTARADESIEASETEESVEGLDRAESAPSFTRLGGTSAPNILALTTNALSITHLSPATSKLDLVAKSPTDIRLSRGAKTAIIVTAIVVGVLVIAGVIVLAKPHRL